jgi:hypothetical protein
MTAPFDYYEQSYPPSVLRRPAPPLVGATAREADDGGEAEVGRDELTSPELVATDADADGEALPDAPEQDGDATPLPVATARSRKRRAQDRRHDGDGGTEA